MKQFNIEHLNFDKGELETVDAEEELRDLAIDI
jgi:hypothetical protein